MTTKYKTVKKHLYATSIPYLMQESTLFQQAVHSHQQASLKALQEKLHKKLIREISGILEEGNIPLTHLSKIVKLDRTTEMVMASYLVKVLSAHKAIQALAILSRKIKERKKRKGDQWQDYLFDVKQLCGWLLTNSIEPIWWLQNGQSVLQPSIDKLANTIPLEKSAYIEVIVSRSLLQQAQYTVDDYGNLLPDKELYNPILFDAEEKASDIQILTGVLKDLRGTENAPLDVKTLLEEIKLTVGSLYDIREKKSFTTLFHRHIWSYYSQEKNGILL